MYALLIAGESCSFSVMLAFGNTHHLSFPGSGFGLTESRLRLGFQRFPTVIQLHSLLGVMKIESWVSIG